MSMTEQEQGAKSLIAPKVKYTQASVLLAVVVSGVIIYNFWEIIVTCLLLGLAVVGLGWLIIHFRAEIWKWLNSLNSDGKND